MVFYSLDFLNCSNILSEMGGPNTKLFVRLDGEAKKFHGIKEGFYIIGNHQHYKGNFRHWVQRTGKNAIWFDEQNRNWKIGNFDNLGNNISGLMSVENSIATKEGPQKAPIWNFFDSNTKQWKLADITIKAIGKFTICNFGNLPSMKLNQHGQIHSKVNFRLLISSIDQTMILIYFLTQF